MPESSRSKMKQPANEDKSLKLEKKCELCSVKCKIKLLKKNPLIKGAQKKSKLDWLSSKLRLLSNNNASYLQNVSSNRSKREDSSNKLEKSKRKKQKSRVP